MSTNTALAPQQKKEVATATEAAEVSKSVRTVSPFDNHNAFVEAQRIANLLCSSSMVPYNFQGQSNLGNCVIALEMSRRMNMSVLAVMQGMYVINGTLTQAAAQRTAWRFWTACLPIHITPQIPPADRPSAPLTS